MTYETPDHLARREWGIEEDAPEPKKPLWQTVFKHNELTDRAFDPGLVPEQLAATRAPRHTPFRNDIKMAQRAESFAQEFERAVYQHRGEVDFAWLLEQDEQDIALVADPETLPHLLRAAEGFRLAKQREDAARAAAEAELDSTLETRNRVRNLLNLSSIVGGPELGLEDMELSASERERAIGDLMQAQQDRTKTPEERARIWDAFKASWGTALTGLGWVVSGSVNALAEAVEPAAGQPTLMGGLGSIVAHRRQKSLEEFEARKPTRMSTEQLVELGDMVSKEQALMTWESLEFENPEAFNLYMGMANGNSARAFGLFFADATEPLPEEQLSQLGKAVEDGMFETMEEFDYRFSSDTLDALAAYSHHVPMRLMTGLSLLLTDDDIQEATFKGNFQLLSEGVAEAEHSVAKVFGWEGTALGLAVDWTAGVVGDPLTYVFGPKTMKAARLQHVDEVVDVVQAKAVKVQIEQIAKAHAKGDLAMVVEHTAWLDDAGMVGRVLSLTEEAKMAGQVPPRLAKALDEIAEGRPGVTAKPYEGAAPDLSPEFTAHTGSYSRVRTKLASDGGEHITTTTANGEQLYLGRLGAGTDTEAKFVWMLEDGTPVAGISRWEDGASWWVNPAFRGKGDNLMTQMLDGLAGSSQHGLDEVAKILDSSLADTSLSEAGAKALGRELERFAARSDDVAAELAMKNLDVEAVQAVYQEAMEWGAMPPNPFRTVVRPAAVSANATDSLNKMKFVDWFERYSAQLPRSKRIELHGPGSWGRISETVNQIWGMDRDGAKFWMDRLGQAKMKKANLARQRLSDPDTLRAQVLQDELTSLYDEVGGAVYDPNLADDVEFLQPMYDRIEAIEKELTGINRELRGRYHLIDDNRDIDEILQEMYNDFNRKYIATQKAWSKYVDEDGMVPWEVLQGRDPADLNQVDPAQFFSDEAIAVAPELEQIAQAAGLSHVNAASVMPIPVLDMLLASKWGGSKYMSKIKTVPAAALTRELAYELHRAWVIDRVMTPAVAAVASLDELMRVFHRYGPEAMQRYLRDKAIRLEARAVAAAKRQGISPGAATADARASVVQRLTELEEMPAAIKNGERAGYEGLGQGWMDIKPGDPGYVDAARRSAGSWLQKPGFRAFLKGEDEFRTWWFQSQQHPHVINKTVPTWEEAYQGYKTVYEYFTNGARKAGRFNEVDEAWRSAAARTDEIGGNAVIEMPEFVFEDLGTVRGVHRVAPNKAPMAQMQDWFFDKFFMTPTNYRRGFINKLAVEQETERLARLFASQNKRIVSYDELAQMMGLRSGLGLEDTFGPALDDIARQHNVVTEGYVRRLAEARATDEIKDIMYSWDTGSRLGQQTRGIFPFGGPWADMWGWWGREMLTKPHLRGWINEANFFGLGDHVRSALNATPINPRVPALVSRLSATDFEIDRGWVPWDGDEREGLLPGSESTNLSPLFFLPTGGDTPFQALIPPLGYIPIGMLDVFLTEKFDPIENPTEYRQAIDAIADFLPGIQFTTGPAVSDIVGGGTFGKMAGVGADLYSLAQAMSGRDTGFYEFTSFLGDIGREVDRTRSISAVMADPKVLETLLAAADEETVDLLIQSYAVEASKKAAQAHLGEIGTRLFLPARNRFDTALDEITDVWIEAAGKFPNLTVHPTSERLDLSDPANRRIYANDIRNSFFDLDQWERDLYIAQYPQLAVNLVASWTWTTKGINELGQEAQAPYRSGGDRESRDRHQLLIDQGYIRPVPPQSRAYQILGLIKSSKENAAKDIYSAVATSYNDWKWTSVPEATQANLQWFIDNGYGASHGITDVRTLWENWGSLEGDVERWYGREFPDVSEERIKEVVAIPTKQQAWSSSWPGIDGVSERFSDLTINEFPEQAQVAAKALGLELTPGMTGEQLFQGVQNLITTSQDGPLWNMVDGPYDAYILERTAAGNSAMEAIRNAGADPDADPQWRERLWDFVTMAENIQKRVFSRPGPATLEEMNQVREGYMALYGTDSSLAWENNWKHLYERTFGKLEWEPPTPPELHRPNGELSSSAYAPVIRKVVDGDTLQVSETVGSPSFFGLGGGPGQAKTRAVRILGLRTPEFSTEPEAAEEAREELLAAIRQGVREGKRIYLVRDPNTFGNTDRYGRELAWLFIGDEPYYSPDAFLPTD